MKEDAVYPSYFNFFQRAYQKRLFWCQQFLGVAVGCILILQADPQTDQRSQKIGGDPTREPSGGPSGGPTRGPTQPISSSNV